MNAAAIAILLTWISLSIALVAAGFWWRAATVVVRSDDAKATRTVTIKGVDVESTARAQSRWNARAAFATASALICQAVSQAIQNWDFILEVAK